MVHLWLGEQLLLRTLSYPNPNGSTNPSPNPDPNPIGRVTVNILAIGFLAARCTLMASSRSRPDLVMLSIATVAFFFFFTLLHNLSVEQPIQSLARSNLVFDRNAHPKLHSAGHHTLQNGEGYPWRRQEVPSWQQHHCLQGPLAADYTNASNSVENAFFLFSVFFFCCH